MEPKSLSFAMAAEGAVAGCPARILLGCEKGEFMGAGELLTENKPCSRILTALDPEVGKRYGDYVDQLLPALPDSLRFSYVNGLTSLSIEDGASRFRAAAGRGGGAVVFAFEPEPAGTGPDSTLMEAARTLGDFFGVRRFYFFGRTGSGIGLYELLPECAQSQPVPAPLNSCRLLLYSQMSLQGEGAWVQAVRSLFGLKEAELFIGGGGDGFFGAISIPAFHTDFMEGSDLYLMAALKGRVPSMELHGSFRFSYLPQVEFSVNCALSAERFMIEALASMEEPVPLAGPFSLGDTCLAVGFDRGPSFAMFTNLYIRKLHLFGAVMLGVTGPAVELKLLSVAVSDLSIPSLVENLLGMEIDGIETIDFIRILGLPFQEMESFSKAELEAADERRLVQSFNRQVTDPSLVLEETQVKAYPFGGGVDLVDQKRMRHYYIRPDGRLQLSAQFYYASVDTVLGNYTVQKGMFLCGVIEIFRLRLEVLFSFREKEGVLAYACIPSVDLGFLKLGPSKGGASSGETLPIPADSVLYQFMGKEQKGVVFFLSAGKEDVIFFLDGRVELLSILSFETRIIFCKGYVSVDVGFSWLVIFDVRLHIKVDYRSFETGGFEFSLVMDVSKLAKKLRAVQASIEGAVKRCREKINQATKEIDRAQNHVNELYSQIDSLNRKISQCKADIKNAKWWKKAFVAIAKGVEIGAYEVAKAGIYAAIGVATAALQVAKKVVQLAGVVGEAVLKAVNAVIDGALSLFYINKLELYGKASMEEQSFRAAIEFVALGKTYRYETRFGKAALVKDAEGTVSGDMNGKMKYDLDHIEDGAFKSNWNRYKHETYTIAQQCRRLEGARSQLSSSARLLKAMEEAYVEEFKEPMADFDQINQEYLGALDCVGGILNAGDQAGRISTLSKSMGGLKRSVAAREKKGAFRDGELSDMKAVIHEYDEAKLLYDQIKQSMSAVERQRTQMLQYAQSQKAKTGEIKGARLLEGRSGSMERVLNRTEEALYQAFPVDRSGKDYINPSREKSIHQYLDEARSEFGAEASKKVQVMRSRSRKGVYDSRL